ncbi:MAG TPA: sugar phosphate isomerase/epimerase family protein [Chthonomonadaceae bacterium]|nr:sugar phosphate isomerase/epimerase family protein [Chthonomonadaceae bacterium]
MTAEVSDSMEIGSCAGQVVGETLEDKMNALHALGYDFIEPAWREEDVPKLGAAYGQELKALGERTGCPVLSAIYGLFSDLGKRLKTPGSRALELDTIGRACETLAAAGGDVLLLPNWAGQQELDYDALYTAFLQEAGDQAARLGVKLGIEHIPASKYRNTAAQVFELAELVNRPNVGVYFDIANGIYIGDDPLESAQKVAPRVVQYHVKGYRAERPLEAMPLKEVKAVIEAAGFRGRVATEIGPSEEPGKQTNAHLAAAIATLRQNGF